MQVDYTLENGSSPIHHALTVARALTPLGGYLLGVVTGGGQGSICYLTDAECASLAIAANAHKAVGGNHNAR